MDGCTHMSLQEAIRVQLDEMELLEMAYPELVFDQPDPRPLLRAALDEWDAGQPPAGCAAEAANETTLQAAIAGVPLVAFRCPLSSEATLRIRLPRRYPLVPLTATVEGTPSLPPRVREKILSASKMEANRFSGESRHDPHSLQVLSEATLASSDDPEEPSQDPGTQIPGDSRCTLNATAGDGDKPTGASDGHEERTATGWRDSNHASGALVANDGRKDCRGDPQAASGASGKKGVGSSEPCVAGINLGRRLIYSHHIIAPQKRTGILRSARELGLGGYSKIGWPGVIVVEGEESSCEEFVKILRTWRWKHLAVRGEETQRVPEGRTIDQERRLPPIMEELTEKDGVSAVANLCKTAGLGDLFATLLR